MIDLSVTPKQVETNETLTDIEVYGLIARLVSPEVLELVTPEVQAHLLLNAKSAYRELYTIVEWITNASGANLTNDVLATMISEMQTIQPSEPNT